MVALRVAFALTLFWDALCVLQVQNAEKSSETISINDVARKLVHPTRLLLEQASIAELKKLPVEVFADLTAEQVLVLFRVPYEVVGEPSRRKPSISRLDVAQIEAMGPTLRRISLRAGLPLGRDVSLLRPEIFAYFDAWSTLSRYHLTEDQAKALLHLGPDFRDVEGVFYGIDNIIDRPFQKSCRVAADLREKFLNPYVNEFVHQGMEKCILKVERKMTMAVRSSDNPRRLTLLDRVIGWLAKFFAAIISGIGAIYAKLFPNPGTSLVIVEGLRGVVPRPLASLAPAPDLFLTTIPRHDLALYMPIYSNS